MGRKIYKNKPNLSEMHITNYNHAPWYVSCKYIKKNPKKTNQSNELNT